MKSVVAERLIQAPLELVFEIISVPERFTEAVPQIRQIEYLTEQTSGAGTRFLETRAAGKGEHTLEMEVRQLVPNESIRIVSEAGGTLWDSVFSVSPEGEQVRLTLKMDATPRHLLARMMNGVIWRMVVKGVEGDMDAVKTYCERRARGDG